jgi:hypothetical protein
LLSFSPEFVTKHRFDFLPLSMRHPVAGKLKLASMPILLQNHLGVIDELHGSRQAQPDLSSTLFLIE